MATLRRRAAAAALPLALLALLQPAAARPARPASLHGLSLFVPDNVLYNSTDAVHARLDALVRNCEVLSRVQSPIGSVPLFGIPVPSSDSADAVRLLNTVTLADMSQIERAEVASEHWFRPAQLKTTFMHNKPTQHY